MNASGTPQPPLHRFVVEVDDETLAEAAAILGTAAKKDTVNSALLEMAQRHRRALALAELCEMGARGDFDILLDKGNYRR